MFTDGVLVDVELKFFFVSVPVTSKYPNLPFDEQDDPTGEDREGASVSGSRERPASKAPALDEDGPSSSPDH
ncbi:hypothetical protein NL676_029217 [Syzygium grande]|nr:hypothetical protein NL676_029217 [Syzygium grande]